ncbi:phenylacetate--CoA ligase family protein [Humitalea sp. 24SJ18S-53]|uniref:phenylacetate--CoA ligase family protein n=1 Tax=Humitalea sp. 24SJ18S-53 TaxID=3422307 RepID=UPI003D671884
MSAEFRSADQRATDIFRELPLALAHARRAAAYRDLPDGPLASLPVSRKADLIAAQAAAPPFGGMNPVPMGGYARVFVSPGPIVEGSGFGPDPFRFARALHATGLRAGDLLHNCFAYHFTPAGFMLEGGAHALGCPVFPAGTGNTDQQARAMAALRPVAYSGTPDFLKAILEKADELGLDVSSLRLGHVSGGAYLPALRAFYAARGLTVRQSYASADAGVIAYETEANDGLVVDDGVIVEIVRPGTGDVVPDGEVGEVLVTTLSATTAWPLVRFATGDLSAVLPGQSPCGRTNMRLRGWMGRADQAAKVRGMFVRPEQVAAALRAVPSVARARLIISLDGTRDVMLLRAEATDTTVADALAAALADATKLRGTVEIVPPGSLPNDGRVIEDQRPAP